MKDVAAIALVVAMISTKAAAMQYECRGHWEDGGSDTVFLQFDMGGWISNLFSGENKGTGAIVSKKYPSLSTYSANAQKFQHFYELEEKINENTRRFAMLEILSQEVAYSVNYGEWRFVGDCEQIER